MTNEMMNTEFNKFRLPFKARIKRKIKKVITRRNRVRNWRLTSKPWGNL